MGGVASLLIASCHRELEMLNSNMALQAHNLTLNSLKKSQLVKPKVWLIPVDSTMTSPCSMKVPLRTEKIFIFMNRITPCFEFSI